MGDTQRAVGAQVQSIADFNVFHSGDAADVRQGLHGYLCRHEAVEQAVDDHSRILQHRQGVGTLSVGTLHRLEVVAEALLVQKLLYGDR